MLNRYFPMLANFCDSEKLNLNRLRELQSILDLVSTDNMDVTVWDLPEDLKEAITIFQKSKQELNKVLDKYEIEKV